MCVRVCGRVEIWIEGERVCCWCAKSDNVNGEWNGKTSYESRVPAPYSFRMKVSDEVLNNTPSVSHAEVPRDLLMSLHL